MLEPDREFLCVQRQSPLWSFASTKPVHPLGDVGNEIRTRHLAIIADIDAGLDLPCDDVIQRNAQRRVEGVRVEGLFIDFGDQDVRERLAAR